jgi:C4-type Zn-finger protein
VDLMHLPRWMHKAYAFAFGYFWLPCPVCGRMFGGHERPYGSVPHPTEPHTRRITCPNCATYFGG